MWHVTPALVEAGIISMWKRGPAMLRKAYVIALDMRILYELLSSCTSIEFSLELTMLAYQEDMVNLETWLMGMLTSRGVAVISAISLHLAKKAQIGEAHFAAQLSVNAVRIFFRCIGNIVRTSGGTQPPDILEGVQEVHQAYARLSPRLADVTASLDLADPKLLIGNVIGENSSIGNRTQQELTASPPNDTSDSISEAAVTAAIMLLPAPVFSNSAPASFPNSIEKEASVYFENLYTRNLSTERAVEVLRGLKEFGTEYDHSVFHCVIHSLFDEYRFFRKYPDKELEITRRLFGSIVQELLLEGHLQGLAVKCVLDALKTVEPAPHPAGRLVTFGLFALERYVSRLPEWPQYCTEILKLPRLLEITPAVMSEVQRALDAYRGPIPSAAENEIGLAVGEVKGPGEAPLTTDGAAPVASVWDPEAGADAVRLLVSSPPPATDTTPMKDPAIYSSALCASPSMNIDSSLAGPLNLCTLLGMTVDEAKRIVAPDETMQDKINVIFNNFSHMTLDDKVEEPLDILEPQYHPFFSVYIVLKRVSSESNYHHLYLTMLEKIAPNMPSLFPIVLDTTYKRVRVLLESETIVSRMAERTVLKRLGSWVGSLTLAQNQPILRRDLDLKELLMDAYSRGRLIAVFPFVSKVLEASQGFRIFKTTNPWIRGVLSLMKEIYCVVDLKLSMKFELQLECKSLSIDVNEVTPSDLLRYRPAPDKNNNPDFNTNKKPANASPIRSSQSPATSVSPEMRRAYAQAGATGRSRIPVFSLANPQASASALPAIPVSVGPGFSAGPIDVDASLISNKLAWGPDSFRDLTNMLANASLTSGSMAANQMPGSNLHAADSISETTVLSSALSHRPSSGLSSDGTLTPHSTLRSVRAWCCFRIIRT